MDRIFLTTVKHKTLNIETQEKQKKDLVENIILQNENFQIISKEIEKANNELKCAQNMIYQTF